MTVSWIRNAALSGLLVAVAGCGGKGPETGEAVVVPEPNASVPTVGTSATAPAATSPGAATPASTSTSAPAAATKAEGWGTFKGKITLKGDAPKPKVLAEKGKADKDPTVCAKETPIVSERVVVDEATKGVKNVLVYIPKPTAVNPEAVSAVSAPQIVFDQENCVFKPHVLALMKGAKVDLKNSDPVSHNINSRLKNNGFNQIVPASQELHQAIDNPERSPGELTCDIHPWMRAYWLVLDNPYFAVTDDKGNYEIKNAPAGTQKVVVWQEAAGFVTPQSGEGVDVKAGAETSKDFTIDSGKLKPE